MHIAIFIQRFYFLVLFPYLLALLIELALKLLVSCLPLLLVPRHLLVVESLPFLLLGSTGPLRAFSLQHLALGPQSIQFPQMLGLFFEKFLPQLGLPLGTGIQLGRIGISCAFSLRQLSDKVSLLPLQILVFLEQPALVGLSDEIELVQAAKLPMVLLEMVLQMLALILEKFGLFDKVVVLRAVRPLLLPAGNIELVLALVVGPNLEIFIETALAAHLEMLRHLKL